MGMYRDANNIPNAEYKEKIEWRTRTNQKLREQAMGASSVKKMANDGQD